MTSRLQHLVWNMFPVCNNLHRSSVGRGLAGITSCSSTVPTKWMIAAKTPEVKSSARSECESHSQSQWTGPVGSSTCWSPRLKHQPQCHSVTQTNKACHYGSGQLRHLSSPPLHLIYHKQTLRVSSRFLSNTKSPAGKISSWVWVHVQRKITKWDFTQLSSTWFLWENCWKIWTSEWEQVRAFRRAFITVADLLKGGVMNCNLNPNHTHAFC